MKIDIQYSPGTNEWPVLRDAILQAEAEGYDTTWVFDHFDGAMIQGDRPMLECFTLLGALAAATSTIGLGTLVAECRQSSSSRARCGSVQCATDQQRALDAGSRCRHRTEQQVERRACRP